MVNTPRLARTLRVPGMLVLWLLVNPGVASPASSPTESQPPGASMPRMTGPVRIAYLHHSTGKSVWDGGVPAFIQDWNKSHRTDYRVQELTYPATTGGLPLLGRLPHRVRRVLGATYPWANYPYDYWNLWIAHAGKSRDRGELNLDDLVKDHDVIVFKHCFPVSGIRPEAGSPSVSSEAKTLGNYRLQYEALKKRLHEFPSKRFIVWTGPALTQASTTAEDAERARQFFEWVKGTWDEKGDNIFVWDFHALETEGGLYLKPEFAAAADDSHPNAAFSRAVAPAMGQRIVDVIEGRGDTAGIVGR
jgi:hypothetical protein